MNVFLSIEDCKLNTTGNVFLTVLLDAPNWGDECPVVRTNIAAVYPQSSSPTITTPNNPSEEDEASPTPEEEVIALEVDGNEDAGRPDQLVAPAVSNAAKPSGPGVTAAVMSPLLEDAKKPHKRGSKSRNEKKSRSRSRSNNGQDDADDGSCGGGCGGLSSSTASGINNTVITTNIPSSGDAGEGAGGKKQKGHKEHRYLSRNKSSRSFFSNNQAPLSSSSSSRQQQPQQQQIPQSQSTEPVLTPTDTSSAQPHQISPSSSSEALLSLDPSYKQQQQQQQSSQSAQSNQSSQSSQSIQSIQTLQQHHKKSHRGRSSVRKDDSSSGEGKGTSASASALGNGNGNGNAPRKRSASRNREEGERSGSSSSQHNHSSGSSGHGHSRGHHHHHHSSSHSRGRGQHNHSSSRSRSHRRGQFINAMFLLGDEACDSSKFNAVKFDTNSWSFRFPTVADGLQSGLYNGAQLVFSANCALSKKAVKKSDKRGTIRTFGSFCLALENPVLLKALAAGESFVAYAEITTVTTERYEVVGTFIVKFWAAPEQFDVESPDFAGAQMHDARSSPLALSQTPSFTSYSPQGHLGHHPLEGESSASNSPVVASRGSQGALGVPMDGSIPQQVQQQTQQQDSQFQIPLLSLSSARGSFTNISLPPLSKSSPIAPRSKHQRPGHYRRPSKLSQLLQRGAPVPAAGSAGGEGEDRGKSRSKSRSTSPQYEGSSSSPPPYSSQNSGEAGVASGDVLSTAAECEGDEDRTTEEIIDAVEMAMEDRRTPRAERVELATRSPGSIEFCGSMSSMLRPYPDIPNNNNNGNSININVNNNNNNSNNSNGRNVIVSPLMSIPAVNATPNLASVVVVPTSSATALVAPANPTPSAGAAGGGDAAARKEWMKAMRLRKGGVPIARSTDAAVFYVHIHAAVNLPLVQGRLPSPFASLKTELEALAKQKAKSTTSVEEAVRTAVWRDVMSVTLPASAAAQGSEGLFLALIDFPSKRFMGKINITPRALAPGECCHTGLVLNDEGAYALVSLYRKPLRPSPLSSSSSTSTSTSASASASSSTSPEPPSQQALLSSSGSPRGPYEQAGGGGGSPYGTAAPPPPSSLPQQCFAWVLPLEIVRRGPAAAYFVSARIVGNLEAYEQETPVPKFPFVTDYVREARHSMKVVPTREYVSPFSEHGVSPRWPVGLFPMRLLGDDSCPPIVPQAMAAGGSAVPSPRSATSVSSSTPTPTSTPFLKGASAGMAPSGGSGGVVFVGNPSLSPSPPPRFTSPRSSASSSSSVPSSAVTTPTAAAPSEPHKHGKGRQHRRSRYRHPGIVFEVYQFDGMGDKTAFHDAKLCNYVGRSSIPFEALAKSRRGAHVWGTFTLPVVRQGGASTVAHFTFSISTESPRHCMVDADPYAMPGARDEYFGLRSSSAEVNISAPIATSTPDLYPCSPASSTSTTLSPPSSSSSVTTTTGINFSRINTVNTATTNTTTNDNTNNNNGNNGGSANASGNGRLAEKKKPMPLVAGSKIVPVNKAQKNLHAPPPPPQLLGSQEAQSEKLINKLTEERNRMARELESLKREVDELKSMNAQLVVESSSVAQIMNSARKGSGSSNESDDTGSTAPPSTSRGGSPTWSGAGGNAGSGGTSSRDKEPGAIGKCGNNAPCGGGGGNEGILAEGLADLTREQLVERVLELSESLRTTASFKGLAVDRIAHTRKKMLRLEECERKYIKLCQSYKEQGLFLKVLQEENGRLAVANRECRLQQRIIEKLLPLVPESALPSPYAMAENIQALAEYFELDVDGDDEDNDNNEFFNDDEEDDDDENNNTNNNNNEEDGCDGINSS